jgi:hypothetical protein
MWAKIENNVVTNTIEGDAAFIATLPGTYIQTEDVFKGYIYDPIQERFYNPVGPNGYTFDSENLVWVQPTSPGAGYYWSERDGNWVVDNRPAKPVVLSGTTDYWIWAEHISDPNLDEWQIDIDNALARKLVIDERKEKYQQLIDETRELYTDWLIKKYQNDSEEPELSNLYSALQTLDSYSDDNFYRDYEIEFTYNGTTWRV